MNEANDQLFMAALFYIMPLHKIYVDIFSKYIGKRMVIEKNTVM